MFERPSMVLQFYGGAQQRNCRPSYNAMPVTAADGQEPVGLNWHAGFRPLYGLSLCITLAVRHGFVAPQSSPGYVSLFQRGGLGNG